MTEWKYYPNKENYVIRTKNERVIKFLDNANVNWKTGYSKKVIVKEHGLSTTNGGDWCRDSGPLKKFVIIRKKENNKIVSVKLDGYRKNVFDGRISNKVREALKGEPCVLCRTHKDIEIDHKDGMKDDYTDEYYNNTNNFQPLCRRCNDKKRECCKKCEKSGCRFDAGTLGFSAGWLEGDKNSKICPGCYYYDPPEFRKLISETFIKER